MRSYSTSNSIRSITIHFAMQRINAITHARHVYAYESTHARSRVHTRKPWTRLHGGSFVTAMAAIGIFDSTVGAKHRRWRRVCASLRASLFLPRYLYSPDFPRLSFSDAQTIIRSPLQRVSISPFFGPAYFFVSLSFFLL